MKDFRLAVNSLLDADLESLAIEIEQGVGIPRLWELYFKLQEHLFDAYEAGAELEELLIAGRNLSIYLKQRLDDQEAYKAKRGSGYHKIAQARRPA
jgi:hypothetical protein